jgi:hypothetical protein
MKKWMVTLAAVVAGVALAAPAANATHGTAPVVDSISGTGPGVFAGSLSILDTADWYSFYTFLPGTRVTIAMNAQFNAWDPFLFLYRSSAGGTHVPAAGDLRASYTLLTFDDDSGPFNNSLISNFVLPSAGYYVVSAESFAGFGNYTLSISGFPSFGILPVSSAGCPPEPIMSPCRIGPVLP